MKLFSLFTSVACAMVLFAAPASASGMFPYSGWWGAGYYGSPSYASYPSYTSYYAPASAGCCGTAAPMYSASYGSLCGSGCCVSSCCDPCGSGCGTGCASGSCAGDVPAGSLKPAQDPISDTPAKSYNEDPRSRQFEPEVPPRTRNRDLEKDPLLDDPDRIDQFRSPKTDPDTRPKSNPGFFDETPAPIQDRLNQKPAITDPLNDQPIDPIDNNSAKPVDEKTFFDGSATDPDNTASRPQETVLARSSSLSEVIAPKRLASRSLPFVHHPVSSSKLAKQSDSNQSDAQRPLRWISAPLPVGNIRL